MAGRTFQAYNPRSNAWVKYKVSKKKGSEIIGVKQQLPQVPFKGVPKRGNTK